MIYWFSWYLFSSLLGWIAFPIAYQYLPWIKDRGYSISRILGLLIWGFVFWLSASMGLLPFDIGGLLISLGFLIGISAWVLSGIPKYELKRWLRAQSSLFLTVELIFLVFFAVWAIVRAANPEALGTEKPMELAFINAILRSRTFPPHDPWLSGYAISYYYFGYVLMAMLAKITTSAGSLAFNLGSALIFALSASGAYGSLFNLLHAATASHPRTDGLATVIQKKPSITLLSIWGPIFFLIISNLEGFLHVLHTRGILWVLDSTGKLVSPFWTWLDLQDLNVPPAEPLSWIPDRFWWWWRASRVLQDYDLQGGVREIIDEFPFFSFLLGDLHPHVLSIPFAFLVILFALNVMLSQLSPSKPAVRFFLRKINLNLPVEYLIICAIAIGGLAFLNTWDFPVYLVFFSAAYGLQDYLNQNGSLIYLLRSFLKAAAVLGIIGMLLYLPFYLSFSSQAGGILPNLIYVTRGAHLWVMFAPLLVPIFMYLIYLQLRSNDRHSLIRGMAFSAVVFIVLWLSSLMLGWAITLIPERGMQFLASVGAQDGSQLLISALQRRVSTPGAWITLLILLGFILAHFFRVYQHCHANDQPEKEAASSISLDRRSMPVRAELFILLLVLTGLIMVLIPEFFYLLDFFGWRMNTIFKFYYQAWLVWSIAAAFCTIWLSWNIKGPLKWITQMLLTLTILASLVYPILSIWNKTNGFKPARWTLDGADYFARYSPDDAAGIEWLKTAPYGVVAEAIPASGGSYTEYARAATFSGLPGVLGWAGHENQWRGGNEAQGTRQSDLARLFCSRDWEETRQILEQYQIRYVFLSSLERASYLAGSDFCQSGLYENKFIEHMNTVFQSGQVTIFENTDSLNDAFSAN